MSFVYIIRSGDQGAYKIGVTNDIERRIINLQIGNPNKLHLIAFIDFGTRKRALYVEKMMHKFHKRHHIRGEWFSRKIDLKGVDKYFKSSFKKQMKEHENNERQERLDEYLDKLTLEDSPL